MNRSIVPVLRRATRGRAHAVACLGALAATLGATGHASAQWSAYNAWTKATYPGVGYGQYAGIAVASEFDVWISCSKSSTADLYVVEASGDPVSWLGGVWDDSANAVGTYTDVAIDDNGRVHVCYYDDTADNLMYISSVPGVEFSEIMQTVASAGSVGKYASIAIDSGNQPHISYYDAGHGVANRRLTHAYRTAAGVWFNERVPSAALLGNDVGRGTSIAIDSSNNVHISYHDETLDELRYAKKAGGAWTDELVDSEFDSGRYSGIAVVGTTPHIAYSSRGSELRHATKGAAGWSLTTVDTGLAGEWASIAIGTEMTLLGWAVVFTPVLHVSYFDAYVDAGVNKGRLMYARKEGNNAWTKEKVDDSSTIVGRYTSIGADPSNGVHIAYYDSTNQKLKYARRDP